MADPQRPAPTPARKTASGPAAASPVTPPAAPLAAEQTPAGETGGRTTIADTVVTKIAGIAVREVSGVYALGGGAARAVGAIRDRIAGAGTNYGQGINVEVGETQAAVDVDLIAEYGVSLDELARGVRRNVVGSIERMTTLEVTEVNINVLDVHLEGDDDDQDEDRREPRVL